ncbi:AAA family ATPase [Exiguobacterium sp. AB2]|uniref:AAA family ATPase n=1 Tax=Exiguobacterium sp. AB2 TaxID=1484479 RepID=UPI0004A8DAE9|nr:AAA family ATPase [Exiguobacterium sp. AB2]KDN57494.1 hypothetical protein DI14_13530 [Exiguobacterium sp. AB2]
MALVNLNELYRTLSSLVRGVDSSECVLSSSGQNFILRTFTSNGYSRVDFERSTTVFVDEEGRVQYCPNQYFRLVPLGFEYFKALKVYKRDFILIDNELKVRRGVTNGNSVLKEYKNTSVDRLPESVSTVIDQILSEEGRTDQEISYFKRFICDYAWWHGSKDISRTDFHNSPLLSLLNVVHTDNGFYMKLIPIFDLELTRQELTDFLDVQVLESEPQVDDVNRHEANEETPRVVGKNLIVYGAPGTGKSYKLGQLSSGHTVMTTTFHSEYSYSDFIGTFRPVPLYHRQTQTEGVSVAVQEGSYYDAAGNEFTRGRPFIDYRFVPGDLLKVLKEAIQAEHTGSRRHYVLVIEELNRGNAAAIFGDFFQLLDRDATGRSKYSIMNGDVVNYLKETLGEAFSGDEVYIPGNLSIYATMNSADQGVFPLDTAFKRRWNYEYLRINYSAIEHGGTKIPYGGGTVLFKNFMETINENLSARLQVHEDKLLGSYFVSPEELGSESDEADSDHVDRLKELVSNKILMYLWDDVARYQRASIFRQTVTFGDVIHQYKAGEQIFTFDFPIEYSVTDLEEETDGEEAP